jgi:hypothetical protein
VHINRFAVNPTISPIEEGLIRRAKTSCLSILGLLFSVGSRLELENFMRHNFPCKSLNFGGMQLRRFVVYKKVSGHINGTEVICVIN